MSKRFVSEGRKAGCYLYNFREEIVPYPEEVKEKIKPPTHLSVFAEDTKDLFNKTELTVEEIEQLEIDNFRKAERIVVNNFYIGGNAYKKGVLDFMYKGVDIFANQRVGAPAIA